MKQAMSAIIEIAKEKFETQLEQRACALEFYNSIKYKTGGISVCTGHINVTYPIPEGYVWDKSPNAPYLEPEIDLINKVIKFGAGTAYYSLRFVIDFTEEELLAEL